jgi:valacyclovir hydrolase
MHRVVLSDGASLAYHDEGLGSPVLLLHGFTGTARSHMGLLSDALRPNHRVIAPDLRGYGASRPPMRTFPADFYRRDADDMAALLRLLDLGPVAVIGFSDGAESAVLLAAYYPALVRAVVAFGISGVISAPMAAAAQQWLPVAAWGPERAAWRAEIVADQGEDQVEALISGWAAAAQAIHAAGGNICYAEASAVRCPTLLINGDGEVNNLPGDFARLAARIPACRAEIVAQSGHGIQFDQPARLLELIHEFLT